MQKKMNLNFAHRKNIKNEGNKKYPMEYVMKLQNKLSVVSASRWIDSIPWIVHNVIPRRWQVCVCKCHTTENE